MPITCPECDDPVAPGDDELRDGDDTYHLECGKEAGLLAPKAPCPHCEDGVAVGGECQDCGWQFISCPHCGHRVMPDNQCSGCGYVMTPSEYYGELPCGHPKSKFKPLVDENGHWQVEEIDSPKESQESGEHTVRVEGFCGVCGEDSTEEMMT